jgi:hypothetical protein
VATDRQQSLEDLETFGRLADQTAEAGGVIAFEWPTGVEGWALPQLVAIINRHQLIKVHFHGCMLGLVTPEGVPMRKAWTVATNCSELRATLAAARCDGKHPHHKIEGKLTELSGFYPEPMAVAIHQALQKWWDKLAAASAIRALRPVRLLKMSMAEHIRNNHVPYRHDCMACQQGHGRSRRHPRQKLREYGSLAVDLCGPIKHGGDGTKYILIGAYSRLVPEAGSAEAEEESEAQGEASSAAAMAKMSVLQVWKKHSGECRVLSDNSEIRAKVVDSGLPTFIQRGHW